MNEENKQFSNKIIVISFILAFMIVSLHANNTRNYNYDRNMFGIIVNNLQLVMDVIQRVCVPMFFTISGYLFFRTFNINKIGEKYKRRVKTLLIPYLIWNTISYLFFVLLTNVSILSARINIDHVSFDIITMIDAIINSRYSTLWFIEDLMIFVAITPLIFYILKNKKIGNIIMIIIYIANIIILCLNNSENYSTTTLSINNLLYHIFFFMGGAYLALHKKELVEKKNEKLTKISTYLTIIMVLISIIIAVFKTKINYIRPIMYVYITIMIAWSWFFTDNWKYENIKWWQKISFFIYCTHMIILLIIQKIILIVSKGNIYIGTIDYIISPIICIIIIAIIAKFLKNKMPRTWKIITGGRG